MKAYKIFFRSEEGLLLSYFAPDKWCHEYQQGRVTFPRHGTKLFLWATLVDALDYRDPYWRVRPQFVQLAYEIWMVQCPYLERAAYMGDSSRFWLWDEWWREAKDLDLRHITAANLPYRTEVAPDKTYMTSWVVPLERAA